jgi:hypothetical protein
MVGATLSEWLRSIPKQPKAFKIKMRDITELLKINVKNMFMSTANKLCEKLNQTKCIHKNVQRFQDSFDLRRKSLELAIDIYRHKVNFFIFK